MKDIVVIDDFLPKSYADMIEKELTSPNINWHFMRDIAHDDAAIKELGLSNINPAFAHRFFDTSTGPVSSGFGTTLPIMYFASEKAGIPVNELLNSRSFMTIPLNHTDKDHPHVDQYFDHRVCLYYVNDSDGDTVIFNEQFPSVPIDEAIEENLTIKQTVTPKKGRAVLFDGSYYHRSTRPSKNARLIINFNYT